MSLCCRTPDVSAVHASDDGRREDVPLAVHRVQVLQRLRHLGERCEAPYSGFHSKDLSVCVTYPPVFLSS